MRSCEICGTPLQTHLGEYSCKKCGADYINEDGFDPKKNMIFPPPWGEIKIDLSTSGENWRHTFDKLKEQWMALESTSHLHIFKEQFERIDQPRKVFSLYAPKPVFEALDKNLKSFGIERSIVEFSPVPREELYRIRDRFCEEK
jgi:hypothetical protein